METTSIHITGYVVGPIWWPVGAECYKAVDYDVMRETARIDGADLRDHLVRLTCYDGDFQSATLACGEVTITMRDTKRSGRVVRRSWPLSRFPSIADCLHPDGDDWFPMSDDGDADDV